MKNLSVIKPAGEMFTLLIGATILILCFIKFIPQFEGFAKAIAFVFTFIFAANYHEAKKILFPVNLFKKYKFFNPVSSNFNFNYAFAFGLIFLLELFLDEKRIKYTAVAMLLLFSIALLAHVRLFLRISMLNKIKQ